MKFYNLGHKTFETDFKYSWCYGGDVRSEADARQSPGRGPGNEVPGSSENPVFCTT